MIAIVIMIVENNKISILQRYFGTVRVNLGLFQLESIRGLHYLVAV